MGDGSSLTTDQIQKFEKSIHYDEDGAVNDFIQKESRPNEAMKGTGGGEHNKDEYDEDDDDKPKHKKKKTNGGDDSERDSNEGSAEEQEDADGDGMGAGGYGIDGISMEHVRLKPKLTKAMIEELKQLQERDLFEDIIDIKSQVKL